MKKIPSNLDYFRISQENPEPHLDNFYVFEERHPDLDKYISNTKEIKNILITIKTLQEKNEQQSIIDKYFRELSKSINKFSNISEFSCFVNACDNIIGEIKNEIDLLKEISKKYFTRRIINEAVPEEWLQAILDNNSSRKKGQCGENKLISILKQHNFVEVLDWKDFEHDFCVVKFSKKFNLKNVREKLGVKISTKKQNKTLDLIIKAKNWIFLCEAKHLNTSGGEQDKQISELIEIIYLKEDKNVSYISFLDGKYSNKLLGSEGKGTKLLAQRSDIAQALKENPRNYWVNTDGFKSLISDLKKNIL